MATLSAPLLRLLHRCGFLSHSVPSLSRRLPTRVPLPEFPLLGQVPAHRGAGALLLHRLGRGHRRVDPGGLRKPTIRVRGASCSAPTTPPTACFASATPVPL
ncbi:hypothetical protein GUJ93_ZPchr0006g41946 [Zizania palustris]|uniref:Uncharacterized protein n=1 Tax=Zizania palustris TaxID=103762 RepID=A0A8J5SM00_ZIZPA|nr:hypothetical protein GUJ93_ZPchr0006g41946 [Zizania palustris]